MTNNAGKFTDLDKALAHNAQLEDENKQLREQNEQLRKGKPIGPIIGAQTIIEQDNKIKRLQEELKERRGPGTIHARFEYVCDYAEGACPEYNGLSSSMSGAAEHVLIESHKRQHKELAQQNKDRGHCQQCKNCLTCSTHKFDCTENFKSTSGHD